MTSLQTIEKYIARTNLPQNSRFEASFGDICEIREKARENVYDALFLALEYGRAKGYRMAKAEIKKVRKDDGK